jgi:hypothetical protein
MAGTNATKKQEMFKPSSPHTLKSTPLASETMSTQDRHNSHAAGDDGSDRTYARLKGHSEKIPSQATCYTVFTIHRETHSSTSTMHASGYTIVPDTSTTQTTWKNPSEYHVIIRKFHTERKAIKDLVLCFYATTLVSTTFRCGPRYSGKKQSRHSSFLGLCKAQIRNRI